MEALSAREMQVTDLIHQGKTEKEIATELYISQTTVHTHTKNIRQKLHARNIADITRIYLIELKPYAILIVFALLAVILKKFNPQLFEILKTSLTDLIK
jgi:DNA-binding CsgD family transcriptional regulator